MNELEKYNNETVVMKQKLSDMRAALEGTPDQISDVHAASKQARTLLATLKAATEMRVEAARIECTALRKLGLVGRFDLLKGNDAAHAQTFAAMRHEDFESLLRSVRSGTAPGALLRSRRMTVVGEAAKKIGSKIIPEVSENLRASGKPFTIAEFREQVYSELRSIVKDGDPSASFGDVPDRHSICGSHDSSWERLYPELFAEETYDILGDYEPELNRSTGKAGPGATFRRGLDAMIADELRHSDPLRVISSEGWDPPTSIAYINDNGIWEHIPSNHANPEQIRFAADFRLEQAKRLVEISNKMNAWADEVEAESQQEGEKGRRGEH